MQTIRKHLVLLVIIVLVFLAGIAIGYFMLPDQTSKLDRQQIEAQIELMDTLTKLMRDMMEE